MQDFTSPVGKGSSAHCLFGEALRSASELLGFSYISGVPLSVRPDSERPRLQRGVLVENRQQFVLVDGYKLVERLFTVINHACLSQQPSGSWT